nr:nucleolar protein dao-5 isoform X1 [Drosophila suzukii]
MEQVTDTEVQTPEPLQTEEPAREVEKCESAEPKTSALEELPKSAGTTDLEDELANLNGSDEGAGLDELSSLEQEIAKLHHIRPPDAASDAANSATPSGGTDNGGLEARLGGEDLAGGSPLLEDGHDPSGNGQISESPLEEVDLIALLKGTDTSHEQPSGEEKCSLEKALSELDGVKEEVDVGVTIEGEGQFEIMEIDDDEGESSTRKASPKVPVSKPSKPPVSAADVEPKRPSIPKHKLSPEQARAVALEQMAGLKPKPRRKEPPPVVKPKDIVTSLNDDWDDYDSEEDKPTSTSGLVTEVIALPPAQLVPKKSPVSLPLKKVTSPTKSSLNSPILLNNKISSVKVMLKPVSQKQLAASTSPTVEKPKPAAVTVSTPKETEEPTTGFKRMRVIKRKIIWDPDVPESKKSFAQYATAKAPAKASSPAPQAPKTTVKSISPNAPKKRAATPTVRISKAGTPVGGKERSASPVKRRSQTPNAGLANGGVQKKKKVSEIDRLMGDEGAANMIHAVEHEQREMSGGEVSNKPLMRKRAMTITGRQNQALRAAADPSPPKKESAQPATKRTPGAADSVFTKTTANTSASKPRASDSWDYVYKQRASEESMIVRRRSNSSYSSNASVSRNSLDNKSGAANLSDDAAEGSDPSFKFLKPITKTNQKGGEDASSHTLANDMKANSGSELVVLHKVNKVAHLVIHTHRGKSGHTYSSQLLEQLNDTLISVARKSEFNTVLLTVEGPQFCQGIDCQELVQGSLEKRREGASRLSVALKTYLRTLATFPKPLVAGIVGNLINLGVMQLPFADYVVAADDCSLETNYAKLGQLPEGYALWHGHGKVSSQVHSRLFLLGERLFAPELLGPHSFVDKICKARNVSIEAMAIAKQISTNSAEMYGSLKKLNHSATNAANFPRLDEELKVIAEQWLAPNCWANFKSYLSDVDF